MSESGIELPPEIGTGGAAPEVGTGEAAPRPSSRPDGVDLPLVGHVDYPSLGLLGGLAVAGTVGLLEWPVVAGVGVAYALARGSGNQASRAG